MIQTETKYTFPERRAGSPFWALENLPPFPAVAARLLQVVSKRDVHLSEIGKFISAEPVLAAEVLQIANSALFGLECQVKSITQAIMILGLERIKGISLTRAFGSYLRPALRIESLHRCWQNSLAGALLAEKVARSCGIDADVSYTAGLLRDIGRLALLVKYPIPFANMLAVTQDNGFDLMTTERALFDVDHCQAGSWVMSSVPFPPELRDVVAWHHEDLSWEPFGLVQLVQVADQMADSLGFSVLALPESSWPDFAAALRQLPDHARTRFVHERDDLRKELGARIEILARL
ncbi:MAG TPA: HDOD domain-containing protein [Bryobacteraceae bacterium]|nr:HDOD domain-containing protein [Bryobacteraceae bacterium]